MPAASRATEPRPSAPTTSGARSTRPSASVTSASAGPNATFATLAGASTVSPARITASARAARLMRFSSM